MSSDMPEMMDAKVIQTEVDETTYERFVAAADAEDLTIKAAARKAITAFADRHRPVDPEDPLFDPLDWEDQDGDDDASERVDEIVYGTDPGTPDR